ESRLSRRNLLGAAGALAASVMLKSKALAAPQTGPRSFRFVHLTDIHVQPELKGAEGFRKCIEAVHALSPRPDFILTGGDLLFDVLAQSEKRAKRLFDLYTSITRDSDIPFRNCLGNHDI